MEFLTQASETRWNKERYKTLRRQTSSPSCVGLDEIRLWEDARPRNIHHRILVCRHPSVSERTMLHAFDKTESAGYTGPCDLGRERTTQVKTDAGRTEAYPFPLD